MKVRLIAVFTFLAGIALLPALGPSEAQPNGLANAASPAVTTDEAENVELVGHVDTPGRAKDVAVAEGYAYVADGNAGLRAVDVTNPANPTEVGFRDTPGYAYGVAGADGYAYVADGYAGLRVVDVTNLANPTEVGFYDTPGGARNVAVAGGYAYVADFESGLQVLDVSDPANPTEAGSCDITGSAYDVAVAGGYAYIAASPGYYSGIGGGLWVIDISNPTNPTEVGYYDGWYTGGCNSVGVAVAEGYAYLADIAGLLGVVDVSDPTTPTGVGVYGTQGEAFDVAIDGNIAYVADEVSGLRVVDVSDPTNPTEKGRYKLGCATGVAVVEGYAYVADWDGLTILRYTGGGGVDLSVESVAPIQALEGQPLVHNKTTAVEVVVSKTGDEVVDNASVKLTYNNQDFTVFYVADSANMDASYALVGDNSVYPLSFATSEVTKTVYFFSDGLTPAETEQYVVTATVDYLSSIAESNETNNSASAVVNAYTTSWPRAKAGHFFQWLDIVYVRADWDETPASAFDSYFSDSSAFLRGVLPVSAIGFFPEKFDTFGVDSTEYQDADGRLNKEQLCRWFVDLNTRLFLSRTYADGFVAVLPHHWFQDHTYAPSTSYVGLTYTGSDIRLGLAQLGSYSGIAGHTTSAHELGHVLGLWVDGCEQYNHPAGCNPDCVNGIGNPVYDGLWVEQRRLMNYSAEHHVYSFMGASADADFWVDAGDYGKLLNDHKMEGANLTAVERGSTGEKAILAVGTLFDNGHIELEDWYVLSGAQTDALRPGDYYLRYLDSADQVLSELSFDLSLISEGITVTQVPFIFRAPYISDTAKIVIGRGTTDIVSRTVSAHSPVANVLSPDGGERISQSTTVYWSATDQDGDDLTSALLYSSDGGATWNALATGLSTQSYEWDVSGLSPGNSYMIKVMATDGFNTGQDVSNTPFAITDKVHLPLVLRKHQSAIHRCWREACWSRGQANPEREHPD